jgi:hypothetical protein
MENRQPRPDGRRRFVTGSEFNRRPSRPAAKEPDILDIWQYQQKMRAREAQLERENEQAKRRVKELKIQIRQHSGAFSDLTDLQTSLRDDFGQARQNAWLWVKKTLRVTDLRLTMIYLRLRARLGVPLKQRSSFRREKLALALVVVVLIGLFAWHGRQPQAATTNIAGTQTSVDQKPDFELLFPAGKNAAQLGGIGRISPKNAVPAYAYADKLDNARITVTEQKLPDNFQNNSGALEETARNFSASRTLEVDGSQVYIGESGTGPQSLIFQRDGLLILISADSQVSDDSWISYISSLSF